jgi:hypothetical protein
VEVDTGSMSLKQLERKLGCFRLRGQSILLFLDGQLTFELRWGDVPQRGMAA